MAALADAGLSPDVALDLGNSTSLYSFASRPDTSHAFANDAYTLGDYVYATKGSDGYDAFVSAVVSYENAYRSNLGSSSVQVLTDKGEILTDLFGLGLVTTPLKNPTVSLDLGSGNNVSLHSPTLHALEIRSEFDSGSAGEFGTVLRGDSALRDAFIGSSQGVTGALDHGRTDQPTAGGTSTSKVGPSGAAPGIMERALWKTIGDPSGLYAYFFKAFGTVLQSGAAGQGRDPDHTTPSIHEGVVDLALQVLRDTVQDTSTVADISLKPGYRFIGQSATDPNQPPTDRAIIHLSDIRPKDDFIETAPDGLPYGVDDLNAAIFNDTTEAFPRLVTFPEVAQLLGVTQAQVFGTPAGSTLDGFDIPAIAAQGLQPRTEPHGAGLAVLARALSVPPRAQRL